MSQHRGLEVSIHEQQICAQLNGKTLTDVLDHLFFLEVDDWAEPSKKAVRDRRGRGFIVRVIKRSSNLGLLVFDLIHEPVL